MIHKDKQYGRPLEDFTSTKAVIEAISGVGIGARATATDTGESGHYSISGWVWGGSGGIASPGGSDKSVQYNDAGELAGDSNMTWDKAGGILTLFGLNDFAYIKGAANGVAYGLGVYGGAATTSNTDGGVVDIEGGSALGDADAGGIWLYAGNADANGGGGYIEIIPGRGGSVSGDGGYLDLAGGSVYGPGNGGDVYVRPGNAYGGGTRGTVFIANACIADHIVVTSGNYTLTDYNHVVVFTASATCTLLPSIGLGKRVRIVSRGAGTTITVEGDGSDTVIGSANQTVAGNSSLILNDTEAGMWE